MRKFLVLNGPNLDMLGVREPEIYGDSTLEDLERRVREHARDRGVDVRFFQSNSEAKLIKHIHEARGVYDGIIYNPAAHTHYSYALRDAISSIETPTVEVHISDIDTRESFRATSVTAPACVAQIRGRGFDGYCEALDILIDNSRLPRLGEGFEERYDMTRQVIVAGQHLRVEGYAPAGAGSAQAPETSLPAPDPEQTTGDPATVALGRQGRLRAALGDLGVDGFLVRHTPNIHWLTCFDNLFDEEEAHALLVDSTQAVLHTDSRYAGAARSIGEQMGSNVQVDAGRVAHAVFARARIASPGVIADDAEPVPILGVEDDIPYREFRRTKNELSRTAAIKPTSDVVLHLRARKDATEIARMRYAQSITDAAFAHIVDFVRCGMTEREVQVELEDFMVRHGAEGLAFRSIVASGENGAAPHAVPGSSRIQAGQCIVMDFGAKALGYCSDMTRTIFCGSPSQRMREAYAAIRDANETVEGRLAPGITGKQAHELAERILADHGFAGKMGHGLGHGVGLEIHEEPVLSLRNDKPLEPGNVVTVEPGVYLTGEFGMRLEDFGVVTESGFDVFTQSTHDMVII